MNLWKLNDVWLISTTPFPNLKHQIHANWLMKSPSMASKTFCYQSRCPGWWQKNKNWYQDKLHEFTINNTFISLQILCAIIKNGKFISEAQCMDSFHWKWCDRKNIQNRWFSPAHTFLHKTINILRAAAEITKIKTHISRKHTQLLVGAIFGASLQNRICGITHHKYYHKIWHFS